jgi:hypothetical protein
MISGLKSLRNYNRVRAQEILATRTFGKQPQTESALRRLAWYRKIRICYNRVQKNANTTTYTMLSQLNGDSFTHHHQAKRQAREFPWLSFSELGDFHTFVVVRSPYSRLLSAFLQKFTFRREFFVAKYGEYEPTPEGFRLFVRHLERNGTQSNSHWDLQSKQIPFLLSDYDTVIHFENYAREMAEMFSNLSIEIGDRNLGMLFPTDAGKQTRASERHRDFYDTTTIRIVNEIYSEDFEYLGYPDDFDV